MEHRLNLQRTMGPTRANGLPVEAALCIRQSYRNSRVNAALVSSHAHLDASLVTLQAKSRGRPGRSLSAQKHHVEGHF